MKRFLLLLLLFVLGVLGVGAFWVVETLRQPSPLASKTTELPGFYLRVTANYTYLDQPVDFDFVITCGGTLTFSRATGESFFYTSSSELYGIALPDGKALVITTLGYCRRLSIFKKNGDSTLNYTRGIWPHQAPDFMPDVILFEDAELLTQGYFYRSSDAYERPNSPLKFINAVVTRVSREEAADIAQKQPENIVRARSYYKYYNDKPLWEIAVPSACYGVLRVPIPEAAKEAVRAEWPADHPQFWAPGIYRSETPFYASEAWKAFNREFKYNIVAMWNGGSIGAPRAPPRFGTLDEVEAKESMGLNGAPPEYYPARVVYLPPEQRQRWKTDQVMALEVDIRPETRGLAYCGGPWPSFKARAAMAPEFSDGRMDRYTGYGRQLLENKNPKMGGGVFPLFLWKSRFCSLMGNRCSRPA